MPGLNRTGPEGKGSRSGRGLGYCNDSSTTQEKKNSNNIEKPNKTVRKRMGVCFRNGGGMRNRKRHSGWNGSLNT